MHYGLLGVFSLVLMDRRVLFEELKELFKTVSVATLAVSQTAKHNRRADVQSVWPCWSLQPPLPLILGGNA